MKSYKHFFLVALAVLMCSAIEAQVQKPLPSLHVEGKWLCDTHGNHVVLHGVMDTPSMWFNGYDDESGTPTGLIAIDNGQQTTDDGAVYNLAGQRIFNRQSSIVNGKLPRGIYIINGKKVLK